MSKVRVYEVAKQLNMDQKSVVALFQSMGIDYVRNHMSAVDSAAVERVKRHLERQKTPALVEARVGSSGRSEERRTRPLEAMGRTPALSRSSTRALDPVAPMRLRPPPEPLMQARPHHVRSNREEHNRKTASSAAEVPAAAAAAAEGVREVARAVTYNQRASMANRVLRQAEARINEIGSTYAGTTDAQLAGRVVEEAHAGTFTANAAMKGRPGLRADTTCSQGRPWDVVDIEVRENGRLVSQAQSKYLGTAEKTAKAQSAPRYAGQQKVGPSDQLGSVRAVAEREAARNATMRPEQSAHYSDTAVRTSDRVRYQDVESRPESRKGARALARQARTEEASLGRVAARSVAREVTIATCKAAVAGGAVAGGVVLLASGVTNARRVVAGEMTAGEAAAATAKATGTAMLDGAAKAATGTLLKAGASYASKVAVRQGARTTCAALARSNGALAVGCVLVDTVVSSVQLARGNISGQEFGLQVGESASTAGGAWGGMAAGAALGSFLPGLGTLIGGFVGGLAGGLGAGALFRAWFRRGWPPMALATSRVQ